MSNLEFILAHSRTKGSVNGVRNYRNYDGTLTEEGKKRYNYYVPKKDKTKPRNTSGNNGGNNNKGSGGNNYNNHNHNKGSGGNNNNNQNNDKKKKDDRNNDTPLRSTSKMLKETTNLTKNLSDTIPYSQGKYIKKDYSKLSDKDLSDRIRRLELEDRYGKLSGDTVYVKSGSEKVKDILKFIGGVAATAASAVTIASIYQDMKYKQRQNKIAESEK